MASVFQPCKTDDKHRFYPCEKSRCGHKWMVRWREPGGRQGDQREKSFTHKGDADDWAIKVENDKRAGIYLDPSLGKVLVRVYALQWIEDHPCSESTRRNYRGFIVNYLNPCLGRKTLSGLNVGSVKKLQTDMLAAGLGASTINARIGICLSAMMRAAVLEKRIPENPCAALEPLKAAATAVDPDEIPSLAQFHAIADLITPQYRFGVYLMGGAGFRLGEMLAYGPDEDRGDFARLRRQVSSRTTPGDSVARFAPLKHRSEGDYRDVPLALMLEEARSAHLGRFPTVVADGVEVYFPPRGQSGKSMPHPTTFQYHLSRAVIAAGLVDSEGNALFSAHSFRHFFASTALADGVPILEVSRWLGHRSFQVTADTYGHLTPAAPERLRAVLDAALRR